MDWRHTMRKTVSRVVVVVAAAVLSLGFTAGTAHARDISWGTGIVSTSTGQ
jgi:hypothetical protein